jgi:hypothetical protein
MRLAEVSQFLRADMNEVLKKSQLVVVGQNRAEFTARLNELNGKVAVLDLVRMGESPNSMRADKYQGMSW